jgi:hypothetical protein
MANGHLVFGEAVSRVAEALSPLGAAARIVAESCALVVEMREINLEGRRVANDKEVKLTALANRRAESSAALREMRSRLGNADVSAQSLRQSLMDMQREMVKGSLEEKKLYKELIQTITTALVSHHAEQGGALVGAIDAVLNGSGSAANAPVPVNAPRRNPPGRSRRPRR